MDGWINEWIEADFLSIHSMKTSWASLLGQHWTGPGITVITEHMKFQISRCSDPETHMKERNQLLPESRFRGGQSWGKWTTWKDDARWEERSLGINAGWQWLQTAPHRPPRDAASQLFLPFSSASARMGGVSCFLWCIQSHCSVI